MAQPLVLVVDDEEAMRDSCRQVLGRSGMEVATASGGEEGLEFMRKRLPGTVIVDLKMPGMSGQEFLAKAAEIDPDMVAVVITGYATLSSAVGAMKAGAYDFLPKPFKKDELCIVTERALERRRLAMAAVAARREKDRMRDHFVAMVSHQLKSPLASLKECLDAALDSFSKEKRQDPCCELVKRASRRAGQLLNLMNDWLTLSWVESGSPMKEAGPVDVSAVVKEALKRVRDSLQWHDVAVEYKPSGTAFVVNGHFDSLRELFVNLIDNAVRYTPDGGRVDIEVRAEDAGVSVTVADSGLGIPEDQIELVFERFYRGEQAKTTEGTGLGLAIAKEIVEAHGGHISVKSEVGRGTTFKVCLPAGGTN